MLRIGIRQPKLKHSRCQIKRRIGNAELVLSEAMMFKVGFSWNIAGKPITSGHSAIGHYGQELILFCKSPPQRWALCSCHNARSVGSNQVARQKFQALVPI